MVEAVFIGGFYYQAVTVIRLSKEHQLNQHPIAGFYTITDHMSRNPEKLHIDLKVYGDDDDGRNEQLDQLTEMFERALVLTLKARSRVWIRMVIVNMGITENLESANSFIVSLDLQEIQLVTTILGTVQFYIDYDGTVIANDPNATQEQADLDKPADNKTDNEKGWWTTQWGNFVDWCPLYLKDKKAKSGSPVHEMEVGLQDEYGWDFGHDPEGEVVDSPEGDT